MKLAALSLAGLVALALPAQDLPRGAVIPRVACEKDPAFTYALYLPSSYTPARKWPVVFGFDPGGAGERPVRFLEKAAETYGYILMGSNDARNGPLEPILAAQDALWREAGARFSVDPRRAYAAGFSGGARAALRMALDHRKNFAGVLCCGAYLPGDRSVPRSLPFAVYSAVGTDDFNLFELYQADRDLAKGGTPHWVEVFPGPHRWPSAELGREGVEFWQVCAMRAGEIPADDALLARLAEARAASADALRSSGELLPALRKLQNVAAFFQGTAGAAHASAAAADLAREPEVQSRLAAEALLETAVARLRRCTDLADYGRELASLEKLAQGEGWAAARGRWALTVAAVDLKTTGMMAHQRGDYRSSAALFELAHRADPSDVLAAYNAACALARLGEKKEALAWLQKAVDAGFQDADLLRKDPDLEGLRKEPGFALVLERLRAKPAAP